MAQKPLAGNYLRADEAPVGVTVLYAPNSDTEKVIRILKPAWTDFIRKDYINGHAASWLRCLNAILTLRPMPCSHALTVWEEEGHYQNLQEGGLLSRSIDSISVILLLRSCPGERNWSNGQLFP
jgi:hypothetical protein